MVIVHNKASLEPAEELKILLQNFIAILFSELNNMISSDCIHRVPAQVISDTMLKAAENLFDVCQRQLYKEGVFQ